MHIRREDAEKCLRKGDRLIHDRALGAWWLLRSGDVVYADDAAALLADRKLALRPGRDQLPGFPNDLSQSWARTPTACRRRRTAPPAVP